MGNGEVICITHGHELKGGSNGGRGITGQRGIKGRKKCDNCKIYLKKIIT